MSRHARRLRWIAPLLLLALSACSTARPSPSGSAGPRDPGDSRPAAQLVAQADDLARRGQARAALAAYERVLREHPGDPAGAAALHGQGRLQADSAGGARNYRAAYRPTAALPSTRRAAGRPTRARGRSCSATCSPARPRRRA